VSNVGTITLDRILEQLAACPIRARINIEVAAITRHTNYVGRHRVTEDAPAYVRAARWIANEWNKPRAWTTAIGQRIANSLSDDSAEKVYDLVTGETFREAARTLGTTWRAMDRAAYGRIPKTWRHRLEARQAARIAVRQQYEDSIAWWAGRSADYAPTLHRNIDTQLMPIIKEKTPA